MFFFAEKRKASRLITLLLVFMILYLLFLLSLRTGKTSISHFYLYERRFSPVELPLSELKSLNESFRSFETRAVKFPQTFNGNDITQDNLIGGFWPSGKLFMDLHWKNVKAVVDDVKDVQLIMGYTRSHIPLKKKLEALGNEIFEYSNQKTNAFLSGRDHFMEKYKPGVRDIRFLFTGLSGTEVAVFPWYYEWLPVLQPIIDDVLGPGMNDYIGMFQLALMANGADIKIHVDTGNWTKLFHRIHVCIAVPDKTAFSIKTENGFADLALVEGMVFEVNNKVPHLVSNPSSQPRIHLIMDTAEYPFKNRKDLLPGQTCKSVKNIEC